MFLNILMGAALLTVFGTLIFGFANLGKTDKASQMKANKLMRIRVAGQAVAIAILCVIVYVKSKTGA